MPPKKTVSISFRVTPRFKDLLKAAAQSQNRNQTNMLESLVFAFCEQHNITAPAVKAVKSKKAN
jgi:uncharacterized protein (DUF1778 family)